MTCNAETNWISTIAGRFGYAWDRTLYYVKAGGAWSHETFDATCNNGTYAPIFVGRQCANPAGVTGSAFKASDGMFGWTIGAGVEFGLTPNWSAKGEFAYVDFGNRSLTASDGTIINGGMHIAEVKLGLNYRFNSAEPMTFLPVFSK
jgi:outer membrane immunogenic protein